MPTTRFNGERFRELREAHGYSREKVADLLGKTGLSVWRYEAGLQQPKLQTLGELAAIVATTPADLIVTELTTVTAEAVAR